MNKHEQTKRLFKIFGFILLGVGAIFFLVGFIDFFSTFASMSGMPKLFWCLVIGLPLMGFGGMLLGLGFRREMAGYLEKEHAPVLNEAAKDLSPAVRTVTSAVREGLAEDKKRICACGAENEADSVFCRICGKRLTGKCATCGASLPPDAEYCPKCGNKL